MVVSENACFLETFAVVAWFSSCLCQAQELMLFYPSMSETSTLLFFALLFMFCKLKLNSAVSDFFPSFCCLDFRVYATMKNLKSWQQFRVSDLLFL
jgi:hypothetical protein